MTSTVSFKDKLKQAFSFFQWELKSCAGTLTIYSILTAVFMVIILTLCLAIGITMDNSLASTGVTCLLYTSPSPRDRTRSRMPSSA